MENNANSPFPDLLSAALSESGLTDDFDELIGGNDPPPPPQPLPQTFPPQTSVRYITASTPSRGLAASSPSTVRLLNQRVVPGNQIVLNPRGVTMQGAPRQQLVKVVQAGSGDSNQTTFRKVVVQRAAPPTNSSNTQQSPRIVTIPSGQTLNVAQSQTITSTSNQRSSPVLGQLSSVGTGGVRVIRMAAPVSSSGSGQVITVPTADGKRLRLIPVKTGVSNTGHPTAVTRLPTGQTESTEDNQPVSTAPSAPKILRVVSTAAPLRSLPSTTLSVPSSDDHSDSIALPNSAMQSTGSVVTLDQSTVTNSPIVQSTSQIAVGIASTASVQQTGITDSVAMVTATSTNADLLPPVNSVVPQPGIEIQEIQTDQVGSDQAESADNKTATNVNTDSKSFLDSFNKFLSASADPDDKTKLTAGSKAGGGSSLTVNLTEGSVPKTDPENLKQEIKEESGSLGKTEQDSLIPMTDDQSAVKKTENTSMETNATMGFGLSGGGGDTCDEVDFFTAALQQLTDTNKKADEFAKNKKVEEVQSVQVTEKSSRSPSLTPPAVISLPSESRPLTPDSISLSSVQRAQTVVLPGGATTERSNSPLNILPQTTQISRVASPLAFQSRPSGTQHVVKIIKGGQVVRTAIIASPATPASRSSSTPPLVDLTSTPVRTGETLPGRKLVVTNSEPQLPGNGVIKTALTNKDVSRLWANEDLKRKSFSPTIQRAQSLSQLGGATMLSPGGVVVEEEVEEEDEELGHAETYADYMPAKSKIGEKHPDPVVETSSLSSVEPPDIGYQISIPEHVIDCRLLSALQLETIVYASQKHEVFLPCGDRAGFLIGDGAGVGKGRTVAGIIYENYLHGRKRSLWLSVSNDLKVDAERDLHDIGAGKIEVHALNKFKYAKISSHINGSVKKGVIFATYSSLIGESQSDGKYKTRFKQLIHWLGKDFDGPIVFDECHRAKNLCPVGSAKPTKTGLTVLELQNRLPKARVVYASATGASEPKNMAYMTRLGMWGKGTPFPEFNDFIQAVEKRGVGAMEFVAMDMKLRGIYIARQLSFHGVTFKIEEIPLSKDYIRIYNDAVNLWVEAREAFQKSADLIDAEFRMKKTMWGQFWSAHQRFFKYMCISAKVARCVRLARDAVKHGKCVVIGLQSTGEARTLEQVEDMGGELTDFVSTAKGVVQSLVEKHFPAPDRKKTMDLFGSALFDDSPAPSPKNSKRKHHTGRSKKHKRPRFSLSSGSEDQSSSSDEDSEDKSDKSGNSESEKDSDLQMSTSDSEPPSEDDNFNPFGNGSDSDDDPWLKKKKKSEKKLKPKNKEEKEAENRKKTKKEKKKKKKKKKKSKKAHASETSSDDDFDDLDRQMDLALESAGLKTKESIQPREPSGLGASADAVDQAIAIKRDLLAKVERLGDQLPPNALDDLIDQLGGPENVAEMTGRKGRVISTDDGNVQYESRSETDVPLEILNLTEKQRFMDGEKNIAIISEAASSGISLQADRRAVNQRRRVHITLELPWSADRAIQQFGRTHRSNQVSAPEYVFLISELAGERRFASTVAKRLESLGALTHGDRRATESRDLSRFNFDNKYGRAALESVMRSILGHETPMVPFPQDYVGNFAQDAKTGLVGVGVISTDFAGHYMLEKDYNSMSKFLNRILGMEVVLQNSLFKFFSDTMAAVILQAKNNGRWDMGIVDLGGSGEDVKTLDTKTFKGNFSGSTTSVTLVSVSLERGLTWSAAMAIWREHSGEKDGFYLSLQTRGDKQLAMLAVEVTDRRRLREPVYNIYRPNTGQQTRQETLAQIKLKFKKVYPDDARVHWESQYNASEYMCTHTYWKSVCKKQYSGMRCDTGLRRRTYHVLCGSVLSVWTSVERVLASLPGGHATRMQIIRLRTDNGKRIVGCLIPQSAITPLTAMLSDQTKSKPPQPIPIHHPVPAAPLDLPHFTSSPSPLTPLRRPIVNIVRPPTRIPSPQVNVLPRVVVTPRTTQPSTPSTVTEKKDTSVLSMPMFL